MDVVLRRLLHSFEGHQGIETTRCVAMLIGIVFGDAMKQAVVSRRLLHSFEGINPQ
ncbi:MAG: hypothetical protein R3E95_05930 [Thiolinea sp.]